MPGIDVNIGGALKAARQRCLRPAAVNTTVAILAQQRGGTACVQGSEGNALFKRYDTGSKECKLMIPTGWDTWMPSLQGRKLHEAPAEVCRGFCVGCCCCQQNLNQIHCACCTHIRVDSSLHVWNTAVTLTASCSRTLSQTVKCRKALQAAAGVTSRSSWWPVIE